MEIRAFKSRREFDTHTEESFMKADISPYYLVKFMWCDIDDINQELVDYLLLCNVACVYTWKTGESTVGQTKLR